MAGNNEKLYQLLGLAQRAGKVVSGANCIGSSSTEKLRCILISSDISDNARRRFEGISKRAGIPLYVVGDRETLGRAIGKGQRTVVGITDTGFGKAIEAIISGERGKVNELDVD